MRNFFIILIQKSNSANGFQDNISNFAFALSLSCFLQKSYVNMLF